MLIFCSPDASTLREDCENVFPSDDADCPEKYRLQDQPYGWEYHCSIEENVR